MPTENLQPAFYIYAFIINMFLFGCSATFLFGYLFKKIMPSQHQTVAYSIAFFVSISLTFLMAFLRLYGFLGFSVFSHNIFSIFSYFLLWHTIASRSEETHELIKNKWLYINLIVIVLLNYVIFYKIHDALHIRALILHANVALITFMALKVFRKSIDVMTSSEKLLRAIIIFVMLVNVMLGIMAFVFNNMGMYLAFLLPFQGVQMFILATGLVIVLLLDMADVHYQNSIHDKMSGLYNRHYFTNYATKKLEAHQHFAMILCDLDNFKNINDTYEHYAGDLVIKHFSDILSKHTVSPQIAARLGGEEFGIFCIGYDAKSAYQLAESIRKETEKSNVALDKQDISYTVSIGVAALTSHDSLEDYLKMADKALYNAKKAGKNQVSMLVY